MFALFVYIIIILFVSLAIEYKIELNQNMITGIIDDNYHCTGLHGMY